MELGRKLRGVWVIFKRELKAYFITPMGYIVIPVFLFLSGYFFQAYIGYFRIADMRGVFNNMTLLALFISPFLAMRLVAEERRQGTIELLLTSPVDVWQIILGKYLAVVCFFSLALVLTFAYPVILEIYGRPEWGPIVSGYVGVIMASASFLALGVLASSFTESQLVAGVIGFGIALLLWVIDILSYSVNSEILKSVFEEMSLIRHFTDFARGVIDLRHILFYLLWIVFALYGAVRVTEQKR